MRVCLLSAAVAAFSLPLAAEERDVSIATDAGTIIGTLNTAGASDAPVVLLLHGFSGTRDELPVAVIDTGVFAHSAASLAEAGIASLRIDFRGSGASDGLWAETTFSGQVADALAAIDWLSTSEAVDGSRIAVLGWSQGGLVAAHAAAAADIDTLILWMPVTNPISTYSALFGAARISEAIALDADDSISLEYPWGGETALNGAFFDEMLTMSTPAALANYDGPMQVFMGTNDTLILPQPGAGAVLERYHTGPSELHQLNTDHVFDAFTGPEVLDEQVLPQVVRWLDETL